MKIENQEKDSQNIKVVRQQAILRLIEDENVSTQNDLLVRLKEEGFTVTQATISRDIHDLRLTKVANGNGDYHYAVGKPKEKYQASHKFYSIFVASVFKVDYANNLVVIRCYTGMAQAVCATMDSMDWKGVIGTISGDDTILVVMKDERLALEMVKTLREIQ